MSRHGLDRRRLALLALAGLAAPGATRASLILPTPIADLRTPPPTDPNGTSLGASRDLFRRMTAPVLVNGRGPFAFVVDTGANQSVISSELAAQLGLVKGPEEAVNDAVGVRMAPTVNVSLTVGARTSDPQALAVLPAADVGGLGMLGVDRLEGQRLTLDFEKANLRIERSGHSFYDLRDIVVDARRMDGLLTLVKASMPGVGLTAFLDSGAEASIGNMPLQTLVQARNRNIAWTPTTILSASGLSVPGQAAEVPSLHVGGLQLAHLPVIFADLHIFRLWNLDDRPALLIGMDVLGLFRSVSLDFGKSEVRFQLSDLA